MKIQMILATLLCSAALASAQSYVANLNSAQEHNAANTSAATGFGTFTLNANNTITYNVTYSGLVGDWSASHIHGSATSFPGSDASVLFPLNNTPNGTHAGTLSGTTAALNATQLNWLQIGTLYANIHSSVWGGGEIRGQIVPVPEPSTWALMGFGALGMIWSLRRRKV